MRLARIVGPTGRVKAVDIQPEMLEIIRRKLRQKRLANVDLILGAADDRWALASSAGYGFVVTLSDLHSRNKAGKAALTVPKGASVVPAAAIVEDGSELAAVSSDGRLLLFDVEELPELSRGKGNKLLGLPAKGEVKMAAICVLAPGQSLRIISGQRHMTLKPKDLDRYRASRGRRGSALPRGWRKVDRLLAD